MQNADKKTYSTPEFTEFGRIEEITNTKSWHASNDWLGEILEVFLPSANGNVVGAAPQFS